MTIALIEKRRCPSCKDWKDGQEFHQGAWYCKPCANAKSREWHRTHKGTKQYDRNKRSRYFKTKYGISLEEYEEKLKQQDSKCEICSAKLEIGPLTHLDHCHQTNRIRGMLCTNCNRGLGSFHDSPQKLQAAINYVEKYK
jgi:hypothetical protein